MNARDAVALIEGAVPQSGGTWADLGAGEGTFTRALARRLGPTSRIYAVDRDQLALEMLARWAVRADANVTTVEADLTHPFDLPGLPQAGLDGILLANALHFVRDVDVVLGRLARRLRSGGRVVLVEYDRRAASPWVPYPIPAEWLPQLTAAAGLAPRAACASGRASSTAPTTVRIFPGLNHLFLRSPAGTGDMQEYAALKDVVVPAEVAGVDRLRVVRAGSAWLTLPLVAG